MLKTLSPDSYSQDFMGYSRFLPTGGCYETRLAEIFRQIRLSKG